MSLIRFFAAVLAIGACLMAWAGFATMSSGSDGYLRLLGLLFVGGAVAFMVFSARLFLRRPRARGKRWVLPEHSLSQRLIFGGIGLFAAGSAVHAIMVGVFARSKGKDISQANDPGSFWTMVVVYAIGGAVCLYLALRRKRADIAAPSRVTHRSGDA